MTPIRLTRRGFLALTAAGVVAACSDASTTSPPATSSSTSITKSTPPPAPNFANDPFSLGVASGDPTADSVVLWTRLAPEPRIPGGGVAPEPVTVGWHLGTDDALTDVVAEGTAVADAAFGHSVHVDVSGLEPGRPYWYRFFVGDHETDIARTRTAPAADVMADRLRIGHVSCQRYEQGFWTAYEDLATQDLDLVVHAGDYIYERHLNAGPRPLDLAEPLDVDGYRAVYAAYKSDPALRAAHAIAPWAVVWDDHEVDNNYQGDSPEDDDDTPDLESFLARRAAAYQVWWEHMPVRVAPPTGANLTIHHGLSFGRLLDLSLLDTRQYRSDQVCGVNDLGPRCDASFAPEFTMLGAEQEAWLHERLGSTDSRWSLLLQQTVMQQWRFGPGEGAGFNLDQWDGYPAARDRLFGSVRATGADNTVVLTGDVHSSWVGSLALDFDDPDSEVIGTEFVGTSVSSDGSVLQAIVPLVVGNGPHLEWAEALHRGWVYHEVTPDEWRARYRSVEDATVEGSPVVDETEWVVPNRGVVGPA